MTPNWSKIARITIPVPAVLWLGTTSAEAFNFVRRCEAPTEPSCITLFLTFEDEFSFNRCKNDVESYQREVEDFLSCQKRAANEVIAAYNEAVEQFNCRARREIICR